MYVLEALTQSTIIITIIEYILSGPLRLLLKYLLLVATARTHSIVYMRILN